MYFIDRLELILNQKQLSKTELADSLNIRRPTLSDWKKNGAVPAADIVFKIAEYLDVSAEWLVTGKIKDAQELPPEEKDLLKFFRKFSEKEKELILELLEITVKKKAAERDRFQPPNA